MQSQRDEGEPIYRAIAAFALLVGIGALLSPRALLRLYGVRADELAGAGEMGWRLFAARQLLIAAAALSGNQRARDSVLLLQAPDLVIFAHSYRSRSVPRKASVLAIATAATVAALSALARRRS